MSTTSAMDTPNTRSRRKRELNEEEEGGQVRWGHDQRLRRMLANATANIPLPIPSPTQRPSFGPSPIIIPGSSSTSARPARKRPCRAHRSLPSQSSLATTDQPGGSSSVPNADGGILDDLLDRAFKTFSVKTTGLPSSGTTPRRSLPNMEAGPSGAAGVFERHVSSGSAGGSSTSGSVIAPIVKTPEALAMAEYPIPPLTTRQTLDVKIPGQSIVHPRAPLRENSTIPRNPTRPQIPITTIPTTTIKPPTYSKSPASTTARSVPRVGLSARPKQPNVPLPPNSARLAGPSQKFKPHFPQQTAVRCSPRRHPQSSTTNSANPTPSKPKIPTTLSRKPPIGVNSKDLPVLPKEAKDAPSSDSFGDESFDSFDGMFQAGGEDIEALLRTMDGS